MIKVSVIIPVYNSEKYLEKCLNSVLNQTLNDIEIIVINDNSNDKSLDIIKKFQKKTKNLILINNTKNCGIGYNRNKGIEISKGEYISFIDSDDWIEKEMLEKMYNKAKKENLDMVICNYKQIQDNLNKKSIETQNDFKVTKFDTTNIYTSPDLIFKINMSPWNKLYRKYIIKNDHIFPENLKYEDAIFVVKFLMRSLKIGFIDEKLYNYLVHTDSETTVMNEKVFDIIKITKLIVEEAKGTNFYQDIKIYVEAFVIHNLFRYTLQQKKQKDKKIANCFIDDVFRYLDTEFPKWRKNKIWKKRNIFKRIIEENKTITKIYCRI